MICNRFFLIIFIYNYSIICENFPYIGRCELVSGIAVSTQTTRPLMTTKSMVESAWTEDMGQFLYHLDPDTRKITKRLEKITIINSK